MAFQKGNKHGQKKGKHKKTIAAEQQRKVFDRMVDARWGEIIQAQIDAAIIDNKAREFVINQRVGRPTEKIEQQVELKGLVLDI